MDAVAAADALERELAELGTAARAEGQRAYLKSELVHLGVTVPEVRQVATGWYRAHRPVGRDDLVALVTALWDQAVPPVYERRLVAVELLVLGGDELVPADVPLLERLLREAGTWALLDVLAATVVGGLEQRHPDELDPVVRRWAADASFWLRRASLLVHLGPLRRGGGDVERFLGLADGMLEEREFFIRKAIGWVLRETAKQRPDLVTDWVEPRVGRMAGVTFREAVKHLPDGHRARLQQAREGA